MKFGKALVGSKRKRISKSEKTKTDLWFLSEQTTYGDIFPVPIASQDKEVFLLHGESQSRLLPTSMYEIFD